MKKQWLILAMAVCLASCAFAQQNYEIHALRPFGKQPPQVQAPTISYNGGPVFETTPNIYIVYYGKWTAKDHKVIDGFFTRLGGSKMNKINTTYSDSANKFVPNSINYVPATNSYNDNYSLGKSVRDAQIRQIVGAAISGGHLPSDANGIYFVLTATDVADPDGQCTQFCGYHGPALNIVSGKTIKYSMVGNPARCPTGCEASAVLGDSNSPNNDPGADGTINIMWHEFSETTSDPEVNMHTAWAGNNCGENGDCCAWQFGNTFQAPNGTTANEQLGQKYYITQMMLELTSKTRGQNVPGVCENVFKKNP
jgi:hypothetical protein